MKICGVKGLSKCLKINRLLSVAGVILYVTKKRGRGPAKHHVMLFSFNEKLFDASDVEEIQKDHNTVRALPPGFRSTAPVSVLQLYDE